MKNELKEGDVVQLKSGSTDMTICSISTGQYTNIMEAKCVYFADGMRIVKETLPVCTLKLSD
jgi:uncharacterized protein YodC (DUF2158 family)